MIFFLYKDCLLLVKLAPKIEHHTHFRQNTLVSVDFAAILNVESEMKKEIDRTTTLYGDGHAGEKNVRLLTEYCR